ncbi:hypothetical protein [Flavobacterium lindanitolerans]|uniref:hypothetical protein n=1 Tax=Flavobacterium lindanitolerans TaxID=428988 RepID=UPI000C70C6CE|nr:hypothetical protein [Flavobacterium lindanitolerans]MBC8643419.1 hypothetical protein [Flavobacterium lindanitolerans]
MSSGLTYSFIDPITIFAQFFYNLVRKKWWAQLHEVGVAIAKNEEIANGLSKSEVESYLKELFSKTKKSVDETTKYLNESVEKIKGRKAAFIKLANKFERGFFYHLDGEFNTSIYEELCLQALDI